MGGRLGKDEDGNRFVRCRMVGHHVKAKNEDLRGTLFASMTPFEAKRMLFRMTAGVRGWRRRSSTEKKGSLT